uniref:Uncharacterized protein n=1 Tax=Caenorhabditis japonica TaxID=281687 RepID=A0A8R1E557_CAEJA
MDNVNNKRVRTMLEVLKQLTRFIDDEYWEYARRRKVCWLSIETFDDAVTLQNKERTEEPERATSMSQKYRNDCRLKIMKFITRSIIDQKEKFRGVWAQILRKNCILSQGDGRFDQ